MRLTSESLALRVFVATIIPKPTLSAKIVSADDLVLLSVSVSFTMDAFSPYFDSTRSTLVVATSFTPSETYLCVLESKQVCRSLGHSRNVPPGSVPGTEPAALRDLPADDHIPLNTKVEHSVFDIVHEYSVRNFQLIKVGELTLLISQ